MTETIDIPAIGRLVQVKLRKQQCATDLGSGLVYRYRDSIDMAVRLYGNTTPEYLADVVLEAFRGEAQYAYGTGSGIADGTGGKPADGTGVVNNGPGAGAPEGVAA